MTTRETGTVTFVSNANIDYQVETSAESFVQLFEPQNRPLVRSVIQSGNGTIQERILTYAGFTPMELALDDDDLNLPVGQYPHRFSYEYNGWNEALSDTLGLFASFGMGVRGTLVNDAGEVTTYEAEFGSKDLHEVNFITASEKTNYQRNLAQQGTAHAVAELAQLKATIARLITNYSEDDDSSTETLLDAISSLVR